MEMLIYKTWDRLLRMHSLRDLAMSHIFLCESPMSHILNLGMSHDVSYTRFKYNRKSINTAPLPWFESVRKSKEKSVNKLINEKF
jgi:hypothetical protein